MQDVRRFSDGGNHVFLRCPNMSLKSLKEHKKENIQNKNDRWCNTWKK